MPDGHLTAIEHEPLSGEVRIYIGRGRLGDSGTIYYTIGGIENGVLKFVQHAKAEGQRIEPFLVIPKWLYDVLSNNDKDTVSETTDAFLADAVKTRDRLMTLVEAMVLAPPPPPEVRIQHPR